MRLLDRYLLRELLIPFGYCLAGFFVFWVAFDLFSEIDDYQENQLSVMDLVEFYLAKAPELLVLVLPIALLLALLYALTNHARHNELTAMRAAGVSLGRLAAPYFSVGLALSVGMFAANELWVPQNVELSEQILHRHVPPETDYGPGQWEAKVGFMNERDRRTWFAEAYNVETHEMIHPHVVWNFPDGSRREITAERAASADGGWVFTNVQQLLYPPETGGVPTRDEAEVLPMAEFTETPEEIRGEIKIGKIEVGNFRAARKAQLSVREILSYRRLHPDDAAGRAAMLDTKLHGRLAAPWTCLVVVLIALPFGAAPGRRSAFVGVASSIFICFAYMVLQQFALAVGSRGTIPPWLAGWAPNIFFTVMGLVLAWRVR
jgi:lipopolysaccharide export system permease protein